MIDVTLCEPEQRHIYLIQRQYGYHWSTYMYTKSR
jgi:hypothetical protein